MNSRSRFSFSRLSPNGRAIALTEPFWSIPYNMFSVFATLYMLALGLTERQVGMIQTVLILVQIVASLFSGGITELLGRRRTVLFFDLVSWALACAVWAFAGGFAAFLVAAVLSGINRVVYVAFNCLLVEEASPDQRIRNYSALHLMVLSGGFFTPLAGLLVRNSGLVQGTRLIYLGSALVMGGMFFVRHRMLREPVLPPAVQRRLNPLSEVSGLLRYLKESREAAGAFLLQSLNQFIQVFKPLFYFAFLRDSLAVSALFFSLIPMAVSGITMIVLFFFLPRITPEKRNRHIRLGLGLFAASSLLLVLALRLGTLFLLLSVLTEGISFALLRPLIDSRWADSLNPEKRAAQMGAGNFLMGLITVPAGILAAEFYARRPELPFAVLALLAAGALAGSLLSRRKLESSSGENRG